MDNYQAELIGLYLQDHTTARLVTLFSEPLLSQYDMSRQASREAILSLAQTIDLESIVVTETYPDTFSALNEQRHSRYTVLKQAFVRCLEFITEDSELISSRQIVEAYSLAVNFVREKIARQFASVCLSPEAFGSLMEFFGIPLTSDILKQIESNDPPRYQEIVKSFTLWDTKNDSEKQLIGQQ